MDHVDLCIHMQAIAGKIDSGSVGFVYEAAESSQAVTLNMQAYCARGSAAGGNKHAEEGMRDICLQNPGNICILCVRLQVPQNASKHSARADVCGTNLRVRVREGEPEEGRV